MFGESHWSATLAHWRVAAASLSCDLGRALASQHNDLPFLHHTAPVSACTQLRHSRSLGGLGCRVALCRGM